MAKYDDTMPIGKKRNQSMQNNTEDVKEPMSPESHDSEQKLPNMPEQKEHEKPETTENNSDEPTEKKLSEEEILSLPIRKVKSGDRVFYGHYDEERLIVYLIDENGKLTGKCGRLHKPLPPKHPQPVSEDSSDTKQNNALMNIKERKFKIGFNKVDDERTSSSPLKRYKKVIIFAAVALAAIIGIASYRSVMNSVFSPNGDDSPEPQETIAPSDGEMLVIEINTDVIAGDEITEDMLQPATIDGQMYNQIAINGNDLYRWDQRENIIGMYATEYISQGHYITTNSLSKIVRDAENPWIINSSQTAYADIPIQSTELDASSILIGDKLKLDFEVQVSEQGVNNTDDTDVSSGQKTVTINSYSINNAVIADMFTASDKSIFNIYTALLSVPEGNQEYYLKNMCNKNPNYLDGIKPVKIRVYFDKQYADALSTAIASQENIQVTLGDGSDISTTEKKQFYDGERALQTSFSNLAADSDSISVVKGDDEK